jgi:hypothetical protein
MALQRLGDADESRMLEVVEKWAADPSLLVRRAAIAGACEPRLLKSPATVRRVLEVLDVVTGAVAACPENEQRSEPFRVVRLALAYCWSVAVAAAPEEGFAHFGAWAAASNHHVRWALRKNLTKARMRRADPQRCLALDASLRD